MANVALLFTNPAGNYSVGYTSNTLRPSRRGSQSFQTRGVIQIEITDGEVQLEMRLSIDAPWLSVATYTEDTIEEIITANLMRIVTTGAARAWLGVVR